MYIYICIKRVSIITRIESTTDRSPDRNSRRRVQVLVFALTSEQIVEHAVRSRRASTDQPLLLLLVVHEQHLLKDSTNDSDNKQLDA